LLSSFLSLSLSLSHTHTRARASASVCVCVCVNSVFFWDVTPLTLVEIY
jgi:hypothetical protein